MNFVLALFLAPLCDMELKEEEIMTLGNNRCWGTAERHLDLTTTTTTKELYYSWRFQVRGFCFSKYYSYKTFGNICQGWCWMSAILALGRLKQKDHHEFKARLGYIVNSRPNCTTQWGIVSKHKTKTEKEVSWKNEWNYLLLGELGLLWTIISVILTVCSSDESSQTDSVSITIRTQEQSIALI